MLVACGSSEKAGKSGGVSQDKLKIVTSIKPIHAIVLAIAGENADSDQLIPDYASPHNYSFKPSDIRKLKDADIIFRIDEHMESQLNAVFENLDSSIEKISLAEVKNIKLLGPSSSHHAKKSDTKDNHKGHGAHGGHQGTDFHLWTSAKNSVLMANKISKTLAKLDPKNADIYQNNLERFSESVKAAFDKNLAFLSSYQKQKYVVFHNSWQYFADEMGLQNPIVVDSHEGVSGGAKTISSIRDRIVKENINCVFYDSGVNQARLKLLSQKAKTVEIDVLAQGIEINQSTYVNWLSNFGKQVESCFSDD